MDMEREIENIIVATLHNYDRPDLFRSPLVSFSAANDERYDELKSIIGDWHLLPRELLPNALSVISYFVPFTKDVVEEPKTVKNGSLLWSEAYQEINKHFNVINNNIVGYLESLHYSTKTIPPTHTYDPKEIKCFWSHRSAAAIAGLGAFGANRLLITEKGSGGRFCTVITSAPLKPNKKQAENRCLYVKNGSCGLCFKICPVKALMPGSFEKFVCQDELDKNQMIAKGNSRLESADTCGKCISICPVAYLD